ncbi:MAG TPA: SDR family oxidoreductase, partial [Chitinophagales bacterium]|nr:SDR family oxidoreductase [Chitinophagales bacterium]
MPDKKVVIITGASSGIGKALAIECAKRGFHLSLAARNAEQLNAVAEECKLQRAQVITVITDVSKEQDCAALVKTTAEHFSRIDVLINNAGISMRAAFNDLHLDVIRQVMDINFWGTVYCTKSALPHLLKSKGSVVGVSSIAGYKGLPGRTGYSASKFAMQGFLEALRVENLQKGLHVLIACPGFTASNIRNTALNANGNIQGESPRDESKMMTAEEVAIHIMNAVERRKRTLTLTLQGKMTVWLNKFFPSFMDKQVFNHMRKEPGS